MVIANYVSRESHVSGARWGKTILLLCCLSMDKEKRVSYLLYSVD